jgi:hypothetical protein
MRFLPFGYELGYCETADFYFFNISGVCRICEKNATETTKTKKAPAASESVVDSQRRDAEVIALDGSQW